MMARCITLAGWVARGSKGSCRRRLAAAASAPIATINGHAVPLPDNPSAKPLSIMDACRQLGALEEDTKRWTGSEKNNGPAHLRNSIRVALLALLARVIAPARHLPRLFPLV